MSARIADVADDVIDAMLIRSGGAVLRAPHDCNGGEYDGWGQFSRRDVRRLVGAGLIAANGWAADQLLELFDGCHDMNADQFVTWWMEEGLRGLDVRAARRAGGVATERPQADWPELSIEELTAALVTCDGVPAWYYAWCDRTVHGPKLDVLVLLGARTWLGYHVELSAPVGCAWFSKLVAKFDRRCR